LVTSIIIGYIVENVFRQILKHIHDWSWLLIAILFGYVACNLLLLRLEQNAIRVNEDTKSGNEGDNSKIMELIFHSPDGLNLTSNGNKTREDMVSNFY
jgi:hypothetical protein